MPGRRHRPLGASGAVLRQPVRSLTGIALALAVVLVAGATTVIGAVRATAVRRVVQVG